MRISDQQILQLAQYDMNNAYQAMAQAQTVLATGQQINTPADDPIGAAAALSLQGELSQTNGYATAISDATSFVQTTESALQSVGDALMQVRTLAVQGANDTLSASERSSLAAQVGQIISGAVDAANAQYGDRYVLSGFKTSTTPFTFAADGSVTYNGDANAITTELAVGQNVQINIPGSTALQAVFQSMRQVQLDLQSNTPTAVGGADLAALDNANDGLLTAQATAGATAARIQALGAATSSAQSTLQTRISNIMDADFAQAAVTFSSRQANYQAALQAAAKVIQPSLLAFLK